MKLICLLGLIVYTLAASAAWIKESDTDDSCDIYFATLGAMDGAVAATLTYTFYYGIQDNAAMDGMGGWVWEVESTDDCSDANYCVKDITFGWKVVALEDTAVTLSGGATTSCTWDVEIDVESDITEQTDACTWSQSSLTWPEGEDYYNDAADYGLENNSDDMASATLATDTDNDAVLFGIEYDSTAVGACYSLAIGGAFSINTAFASLLAAISLF